MKIMTIPGKELIGKNAQVSDKIYSDDYLRALNKFATVDEVFGQHRADIAAGGNSVGTLVMETLGKSEWEEHLVSLVMTAAKAGEWRAVVREEGKHTEGLDVVVEKDLGYVTKHGDTTFLLPSAMYVSYCKAKLS